MKTRDGYELILLPGKCLPDGMHSELYDQLYRVWKETWVKVFTEVGSPQAWNADTFFRCDLLPVILHNGKIAAFFVATVYPLQPAVLSDHSYFSIFSKSATEKLRKHGVRNVMSYEYMTVLPAWRKVPLGFSLGAVLGELGLKIRDELHCDAAVGVARLQHKVDQLAHAIGGFTLEKEARRGNLICEVVGFLKENDRPYPQTSVHDLVVELWEKRVHVDRSGNSSAEYRIVA